MYANIQFKLVGEDAEVMPKFCVLKLVCKDWLLMIHVTIISVSASKVENLKKLPIARLVYD